MMNYQCIPGQIRYDVALPDEDDADSEYMESAEFNNWVTDETQKLLWGHDAAFVTASELHEAISVKFVEWSENCTTDALPKMLLLIATQQKNADGELCRLLMEIMGDTIPADGLPARNAITELAEDLVRATTDKHLQALKDQVEDV